ncbi:MAG: hypothetical protein J6C87_04540 [Bacteroides sp.]|nr:hypothetical protein [Bacteroides sp.]
MKKIIILSFIFFFTLTSCTDKGNNSLRSGDLVFQVSAGSEMGEAITDATAADSISYDHVGIVFIENGKTFVIEATPEQGVVLTAWEDFAGQADGVVMRLRQPFDVERTIARAKSHLGEAYDWSYLPDNGKMYCSELVYESYRTADGKPIFTARPMNFRNADGEMPAFWTDLFSRLGEPIPEGVPGTNPNDMAREASLEVVYQYVKTKE